MEKEEHYEELKVSPYNGWCGEQQPSLSKPIGLRSYANGYRCDFSMVVMTKKPMRDNVTHDQVKVLLPQMQAILEQPGGMFASFYARRRRGNA